MKQYYIVVKKYKLCITKLSHKKDGICSCTLRRNMGITDWGLFLTSKNAYEYLLFV